MKSARTFYEWMTLPIAAAAFLLAVYASCDVVARKDMVIPAFGILDTH